jgi:hypothetical protein
VRELLDAADCSQAKLADKVPGLYPMALTRHLRNPGEDGAYPPAEQMVRAINRAVAKLVGLPEVANYLAVLALLEGLLPPRSDDLTFDALQEFVAELEPYFEGGAANAVADAWMKLDDHSRWGILGGLTVERGQELVRRLQGKPRRSSSLAIFLKMFSDAGAPLFDSLRETEALSLRFARDRFEAHVAEVIGRLDITAKARIGSAHAIMLSFDLALDDVLPDDWPERRRSPQWKRSRRRDAGVAAALAALRRKETH